MNTSCASDSLNIGDKSSDLRVEIVDKDRLCYLVKTESRGSYGVRTIAKQLLEEFVEFFRENPNSTANEARDRLSGYSDLDRFEYGYAATLTKLAKMVLYPETECIRSNASSSTIYAKSSVTPRLPLQQIYYGAPGTGKSYAIDKITKVYDTIRTTFHPDSDYSTFVGAYKPTITKVKLRDVSGHTIMEGGKEVLDDRITYKFVKQAFLKAYLAAWKKYAEATDEGVAPQFLVIEEINRGNCAQIFGDLFQLLDRQDNGFSSYPIEADTDLQREIETAFAEGGEYQLPEGGLDLNGAVKDNAGDLSADITSGKILLLPCNLYIWATMNTSDQSLFPIDSAFKRRWDWKYVKIADAHKDFKIKCGDETCNWWTFVTMINEKIATETSSDDKKLGYFFCKPTSDDNLISEERFVSKVMFYLWNDVFKDGTTTDFKVSDNVNEQPSFDAFYNDDNSVNVANVRKFLVNIVGENNLEKTSPEEENDNSDDEINNGFSGKYAYNGKPMTLANIVQAVVLNFVNAHPELSTAEEIRDKFEEDCQGFGTKVIETEDEYHMHDGQASQERSWQEVNLPSGIKFYVNTQWRATKPNHNFIQFISIVKANNWGEITQID